MTSLFDQYEQESQSRPPMSPPTPVYPEIKSAAGFINMAMEEETPVFKKQKVNFTPTDKIIHMAVSSELIILAMANNVLLRIDLKHPDKPEEIELTKQSPYLRLHGLYLDTTGDHLLLSLVPRGADSSVNAELLYLNRRSTKIKQTSKFRGHEITAVGWNQSGVRGDSTTKPLLLGTSRGVILETEIAGDSDRIFQTSLEQYWRQVFDIGKGNNRPITGLEFHRISNKERYFILATTPDRIYQFVGNVSNSEERPLLQQIFNVYLTKPEFFHEIPSKLKFSKLQFFYPAPHAVPTTFAWLVEPGILYGQLDTNGEDDTLLVNTQLLSYPSQPSSQPPISFVLTEFHALLLYTDHVAGISILNQALVFEDYYSEVYGKLVSITKDPIKGTIWVFAERAVFRYKVTKEDRNVWQIYMEKGDFELAKKYCKDNPAYIDQVLVRQAEVHFQMGDYEQSALYYAETQSSFEEIALKFLQVWQIQALKTFLKKKLERLKPSDKTQITMIVIWVIELFLNQLDTLRNEGKEHSPEYQSLQQELDKFLSLPQVTECVHKNKDTVYELIASHGDKHNLIRFTIANKDYERVIRHHINKGDFHKALEVLRNQNQKELYYTFAPVLIQAIPKLTVQALIEQGHSLDPAKLLPALVSYQTEDGQANEVIRYLEYCVSSLNCQEQAVHNYLLSLYAQHKPPEKLMRYLAVQGQEASMVNYDVHYALRLCRERGLTEACVQLSALLGLWESAVDLALTVSVDLAKQTASLPQADDELTKKLWLKIAQHVVSEKNDIQQAMEFLQQCELIKIEDILPFFSDFVTIDHFKDAICTSLQEYNQHIQDLKEEMEDATKSAEIIRTEIQAFRNRYTVVRPTDVCSICNIQLLLRPFYVFPCQHRFHSDCLITELNPLLSAPVREKLHDLQKQLSTISSTGGGDTVSVGSASLSARDQVKNDIDSIVASQCLYCGDYMIRAIDQPFIADKDYDRIIKEWE